MMMLCQPQTQVLRIHASSEDDPFFLHTLEVSEEEFQGLKAEQGILVDFASFPGKIISLLERCVGAAVAAASASAAAPPHPTSASAAATAPAAAAAAAGDGSAPPRLQAVLTCSALDSSLRIVETNDFKQLAHISLAFKPGNDFAVKQVWVGGAMTTTEHKRHGELREGPSRAFFARFTKRRPALLCVWRDTWVYVCVCVCLPACSADCCLHPSCAGAHSALACMQFLAFRLGEVKSDRTKLEQGLSHSKARTHQALDCSQDLLLA